MPKNIKGGTGHKKRKNKPIVKIRKIEEIAKDADPKSYEVYGLVQKTMGNRRFSVLCQSITDPTDVTTLNCSIKGSYRRRICNDMYVLVRLYDFNLNQGQIIDSYTDDELKLINSAGLWDFPEHLAPAAERKAEPTLSTSDSETEDETEVPAQAPSMDMDIDIDAI